MRRCRTCLCHSCINSCKCWKCEKKIDECKWYMSFQQLSIFDTPLQEKYRKAPRHSWEYYGITKERYKELTAAIRSGRYTPLASSVAHTACPDIAEYILLSVKENRSYDGLQKLWALGKIDRIPESRTNFYAWRRYFYSIFDKELRKCDT